MASALAAAPSLTVANVELGNPAVRAARSLGAANVAAPKAAGVRSSVVVRAQAEESSSRRSSLVGMLAAAAVVVSAGDAVAVAPRKIVVDTTPPPLSGGLPGTDSADQARDTDAPLKERFYLQSLDPSGAVKRAKESADAIVGVKSLIDKKAWPYVQNELRNKAGYLRFDLNTVISAKPKSEKKQITALANKLYDSIAALDYAARKKSSPEATKNYDETVSLLKEVLAKLA